MTKWEYLSIERWRGYDDSGRAADWEPGDFDDAVERAGQEGWELVAISPRSGFADLEHRDTGWSDAGYTNEEQWVFKRPIG